MTQLEYLHNTYAFEGEAILLQQTELEQRIGLCFDKTWFYPQGGGQPADQGVIEGAASRFVVEDVRLDAEGVVWHWGSWETEPETAGVSMHMQVNTERRLQNARSHSAGHLLDCAVAELGWKELRPTKGFHFPEGAYVEYDGVLEDASSKIEALNQAMEALIDQKLRFIAEELKPEQAAKLGLVAPEGKSVRTVAVSGFEPCGCGGTHVQHTGEIGGLKVRKIKVKKGVTRISYEITEA